MKISPMRLIVALIISLFGFGQLSGGSPAAAQEGTADQNTPSTQAERPFILPFAQPPGPNTWLMAQPYGNTTGAYRQRFTTYGASGGIHFGLDLSAPCGTEVVAIADGIVFAVDGPFGSPPHNLMIDHPQLGYASMYGHLLQPSNLSPGQQVKQGQVVALTGDTAETCYGRPHLHLEIRDLNHVRKYNPTVLIEANWDNLALTGDSGRDFARDLDAPRKWQTLYDQPEARTGGPIINDFANPWPFDWEVQTGSSATPASLTEPSSGSAEPVIAAPSSVPTIGRQIMSGTCCTQPYWSQNSTQIRFIDRPGPDLPLGIWGVDVAQPEAGPQLISERLGVYSPDGSLLAYPDRQNGMAVVERLSDGQTWRIDTEERNINFSPDSQHLLWTAYDEDAPRDNRQEAFWLANVDGTGARIVFQGRRVDRVAWLSDQQWLMSRRISGSSDQQLFTLSLTDGSQTELFQLPRMRDLILSSDKRYLVYTVTFEQDIAKNGIWVIDLQNPARPPQKLPFFGTYRWRDNQRLIYISLDPDAIEHTFYEYNIPTGQTRPLLPAGSTLVVANNDWRVSPDGSKVAFLGASGTDLNGLWVIDLN